VRRGRLRNVFHLADARRNMQSPNIYIYYRERESSFLFSPEIITIIKKTQKKKGEENKNW
jgi:hypothetical protein